MLKLFIYYEDFQMNTKIFNLLTEKLKESFNLPKYATIIVDETTVVEDLPWTPARYRKFKDAVDAELHLPCDYHGTLKEITHELSEKYITRFFGEIWKPRTGDYDYTGWGLVEQINSLNPRSVLDVGCGYHPFKGRISNLVGIDPYNNCADYMVDVLEYVGSHDVIIALGSINFNDREEIESRFKKCVDMLDVGGRFILRANPGISHKTGPYVDIFPWNFEVVKEFGDKYNLTLLEFKKDGNERLYFSYKKNA
jgi:hypothetical protein